MNHCCIQGSNNKFMVVLPDRTLICPQYGIDEDYIDLPLYSSVTVFGNDNTLIFHFNSIADAKQTLWANDIKIHINGDGNTVNLGNITTRYSDNLGMTGLRIFIGEFTRLANGSERKADCCKVNIGDNAVINGATLYLQENGTSIDIGEESLLSWGIDIWCSDGHTITDTEGKAINPSYRISIGKHVWIGKDVKIGKNVTIPDNCIVGWGSVVTKSFDEQNVIIAGNPAQIIKRGVNWDRKCYDNYTRQYNLPPEIRV